MQKALFSRRLEVSAPAESIISRRFKVSAPAESVISRRFRISAYAESIISRRFKVSAYAENVISRRFTLSAPAETGISRRFKASAHAESLKFREKEAFASAEPLEHKSIEQPYQSYRASFGREDEAFKAVVKDRYDEAADKRAISMRDARTDVDKEYRRLLKHIEVLADMHGEANYEEDMDEEEEGT